MRRRPALPLVLALALSSLVVPTAMAAPGAQLPMSPTATAAAAGTTTVSVTFTGNLPLRWTLATTVRLVSAPGRGEFQTSASMPVAEGPSGVVTFRAVPPGDYVIHVLPIHTDIDVPSGWVSPQGDWVFDEAGDPPVVEVDDSPLSIGPVVIPEDGNMTGLVVDTDGAPARVSDVLLAPVGTSAGRYNFASKDPVGVIDVGGLGPTSYRVTFWFGNEMYHLLPGVAGPRFSPVPGDPLFAARLGETYDVGTVVLPANFRDIDVRQQHSAAIMWMRDTSLTTGFDDGTFRALDVVRRDAMAAFLYRAAGRPAFTAPSRSPFTDIRPGDMYYKEMAWLAAAGISRGWPDGTFRPLEPVNRDAMAAFLYRYVDLTDRYDGTADDPATFSTPAELRFLDVHPSNQFYREIAWVAATGIAQGWDYDTYSPVSPVARDAMAAFLLRTLEPSTRP